MPSRIVLNRVFLAFTLSSACLGIESPKWTPATDFEWGPWKQGAPEQTMLLKGHLYVNPSNDDPPGSWQRGIFGPSGLPVAHATPGDPIVDQIITGEGAHRYCMKGDLAKTLRSLCDKGPSERISYEGGASPGEGEVLRKGSRIILLIRGKARLIASPNPPPKGPMDAGAWEYSLSDGKVLEVILQNEDSPAVKALHDRIRDFREKHRLELAVVASGFIERASSEEMRARLECLRRFHKEFEDEWTGGAEEQERLKALRAKVQPLFPTAKVRIEVPYDLESLRVAIEYGVHAVEQALTPAK